MQKKFLLSMLSAATLLVAAFTVPQYSHSEQQVQIEQNTGRTIQKIFDETRTHGVIIIQDKEKVLVYGNNLNRAETAYVPASTFKLLNALIGLENNKVTPTEIFKWDGQKKSLPAWEKDMTLGEGMKVSNVPLYQELARRIGLELMQNGVQLANFGNTDIGNKVDDFWLVGPLTVTPIQEANFAYRLAYKTLPFKPAVQDEVQKMAFIERRNGKKIYGKTGLGKDGDTQVGWLTGWVEQPNGDKIAFSLNMEMQPDIPYTTRNQVSYKVLELLGIL